MNKHQFVNWARTAMISIEMTSTDPGHAKHLKAVEEHDPELARLMRANNDAALAIAKHIRKRIAG